MTFEEIKELLAEENPEALLANGFEGALVGIARQFSKPALALYDRTLCIAILMERDGMNIEEAEEFFEFNTQGAWAGEGTPLFATLFKREGTVSGEFKEFRVKWQQCPHVDNPCELLFVWAKNADDAKALAKDNIERTRGTDWFSIYEATETKPLPPGRVLGAKPEGEDDVNTGKKGEGAR
jgi:hypothetical protein